MAEGIQVIQITDTHLFAQTDANLVGVVTEATFQSVLQAIASLDPTPDLLLLTGDLSQDGSPVSYQRLAQSLNTLDPVIPTYGVGGNHDHFPSFEHGLQGGLISATTKEIYLNPWVFLLLHSPVVNQVYGSFTENELVFLQERLDDSAKAGHFVVIACHHPPFLIDSPWLDESRLQNTHLFFELLDHYPHVRLVLFGHVHQEVYYYRRGLNYLGCPSTCIQFKPRSQTFTLDLIPPGFRQLWLYPDGSFATQVIRVPHAFQMPHLTAKGY